MVDLGDVEMPSGDTEKSLRRLEERVTAVAGAGVIPIVLGGDHTIALPDVTGVARHVGWGRVVGHPLRRPRRHRRLADGFALRTRHAHATAHRIGCLSRGPLLADRTARLLARTGDAGLDGRTGDALLRDERDRVARDSTRYSTRRWPSRMDDCDAVFLSVDVDVVDPGSAPGTGTPEPGGLTSRQLLDAVRRIAMETPVGGVDVVEVSPPYDHAEITAYLGNRIVLEALGGIAWRRKSPARRVDAHTRAIRSWKGR